MNDCITVKYRGPNEPKYQSAGASGCDLVANIEQNVYIKPNERVIIPTGLFVEIPEGYEGQVRSRSGLAAKHGIFVLNGIGTIDFDFRGEIKVILFNTSQQIYCIEKGDRIAQLVFMPIIRAAFEKVSVLSETDRGEGKFGSTGISSS